LRGRSRQAPELHQGFTDPTFGLGPWQGVQAFIDVSENDRARGLLHRGSDRHELHDHISAFTALVEHPMHSRELTTDPFDTVADSAVGRHPIGGRLEWRT